MAGDGAPHAAGQRNRRPYRAVAPQSRRSLSPQVGAHGSGRWLCIEGGIDMIRLRAQHVRTRLTIWYVSVLAGILALYVAGSSIFLFLNLRRELDHSLVEDIETTEGLLRFASGGALILSGNHTEPGEEPDQGRLMEILSPEGGLLYHSRPLGMRSLGGAPFPGEGH